MSAIDNPETTAPAGEVYRAFWRWHFYAGLLVLPILMLMALTGGLYLFKDELTAVLYPLVGASLIAALVLDLILRRLITPRAQTGA